MQNQMSCLCTNFKCLPSLAGPCILYGLLFCKQHIYSEAVISAVGQKTYGYRQGSDIIIIIIHGSLSATRHVLTQWQQWWVL